MRDPPGDAAAGFSLMGSGGLKSTRKTGLTEKQRRFVTAYIDTLDAGSAALTAGYSKRTAKAAGERLLVQRRIVEAIARQGKAVSQRGESLARETITKSWITDELTELYRAVKACLPMPGGDDRKGPSGASLQSAVKMLELLIKHLEDDALRAGDDPASGEPDLSRLDRDELRQLEAILARTVPEARSTRTGGAEP